MRIGNFNLTPIHKNNVFDKTPGKVNNAEVINPKTNNIKDLEKTYGEKELKKIGAIECVTCSNRTYVDKSNDPGVSFKTPTKLDPSEAASMVMSHELEHVSNEKADAESKGREIVSQSVSISTSICAECGRSYVSGGVTETVTKQETKYKVPDELLKGLRVDNKI